MNENQIVVRHESEGGKTPTTRDESQDVSTITKTIKGRGPSKGVKVAKPMFLEYNVYNVPDGQWSHEYGKQVGSCATRININVPLYPKVDEQIKKGFWEETKLMFHITDDSNHSREKYFHSCVAKRFSCFKSKLVRRWITMKEKKPKNQTNKMPWDVYNHITEDDWKTFVKHYFLPESLLRSEKARKSASCNKNPHRTGQKGYNRKRLDWIKDGRLPPDAALPISSSSSVNSSVTSNVNRVRKYRSKEWILAHQVQNKEGKWEIDPNDSEVVEIATKALEYIAEEEKGNLSFEQGEDALTKAIGKKDHRGRVKGTGGMVGIKKAFGPCIRHSRSDHGEASSENYESIRASVKKEFEGELEKRVEKRVAEALQKQLSTLLKTGQLNSISTPIPDDLHLNDSARVDLDVSATRTTRHILVPQPRELKERTPCRLALEEKVSGNNIVVADGMVQPSDGALPQHFTSMKPGHYKVQVDFVYDGHVDDILPVPTGDGFTNLGGALGSFVQWPIHLVIFEDGEDCISPPKKKSKSNVSKERDGSSKKKTTVLAAQKKTTDLPSKEFSHPKKSNSKPKSNLEVVGSCDRKTQESTTKSKKAGLVHDAIQGLGPSCKYLQFIMTSAPDDIYDNTTIPLAASVWHSDFDQETYITASDIGEFLRGACLNISAIQVYILCLLHDHAKSFEMSRISFICPEIMSSTRIKADPGAPTMYLKNIFQAEIEKEKMGNPNLTNWFLIPYNQENHWNLYVMDLRRGYVYIFDSARDPRRTDYAWGILSLAYQVYKCNGGHCPNKMSFKSCKPIHIECAQQIGGTECGYYVMKFMLEIVTLQHDYEGRLDEVYTPRTAPYASEEIDVVREQWAKFFTTKYLLLT